MLRRYDVLYGVALPLGTTLTLAMSHALERDHASYSTTSPTRAKTDARMRSCAPCAGIAIIQRKADGASDGFADFDMFDTAVTVCSSPDS